MNSAQFNQPISLHNIQVTGSFWHAMMEKVRQHVIPYQWEALNDRIEGAEPSYCIQNFKIASLLTKEKHGTALTTEEKELTARGFNGCVFQDSDVAKWLEAVAYSLIWHPDSELEQLADETIDLICSAQQDDGYLDTYYIIKGLDKRFMNLKDHHEMYCLGHFIEGGVAYYHATGKRKLLDALCRYVDCVDTHIGAEDGKMHGYPGHEILEMALIRLYEVTKDEKHLKLAKYFVDQRGQAPLYFKDETERNGNINHWADSYFQYQYYQAGKPVREQKVAEGHAVRAVYLYSGMADVAKLTGDEELYETCETLWKDIVQKQMYITGAIGQADYGEAFTYDYDLPNDTVYAETCASIGLMFFARRMMEIQPKSGYADIMEKELFNGIISGMSLDGKSFFYVNPLEVVPEACEKDHQRFHVKVQRQKWFGCACCPPNVARLLSSVGSYAYSTTENMLYQHLYMGSSMSAAFGGEEVRVAVESNYPWEETVSVRFSMEHPAAFRYAARVPGWCKSYRVLLNGKPAEYVLENGYAVLDRTWEANDELELTFDMPVVVMETNPKVRENVGRVAVMRGPVVYCLEEEDNGTDLHRIHVGGAPEFTVCYEPELLDGVVTLTSVGTVISDCGWDEDALYREASVPGIQEKLLKWIPYYSWANRKPGEMLVWVHK